MAEWGRGAWGHGGWGIDLLPPSGIPAPTIVSVYPTVADILGGTVIRIVGTNFYAPITVQFLAAGPVVVGAGYIFDAEFDVRESFLYVGSPSLPAGTYGLRVTTGAGTADLLASITFAQFAEQLKVLRARSGLSRPWAVGERMLTTNKSGA